VSSMSGRRSHRPPSLDLNKFPARAPPTPPPSTDNDTGSDTMDSTTSSSSSSCSQRPISAAMAQTPFCLRRPTLAEILSNQAPPPYTLSAFMAYLSQNHCLETLEFTMDASRYRKHFNSLHPANGGPMTPDSDSCQYVRMLWQRLLDAYIAPNGPREVNLPSGIRENLLNIPNQRTPPPPESLDPAVNIIYELMEESVLMPFLNSYGGCQTNSAPWESKSSEDLYMRGSLDERGLRRKNNSGSPPPPQEISQSYSPTSSTGSRPRTISPFSAGLGWHRSSSHFPNSVEGPSANASGDSLANDDSMVSPNASASPMTPPSTPPNSDSPISTGSPKYAKAAEKSWKKMTGKLSSSWKKKDGLQDNRTL